MTAINIRAADEGPALAALQKLPQKAAQAANRAIIVVTGWAATETADRVAAANQIPRAVLFGPRRKKGGPRVFVRVTGKAQDTVGSVWIGARPIAAEYMGLAVQTAEGVHVGEYNYPGAFLAKMPSGHVGIFERKEKLTKWSKGRPHTWQPNLPLYHVYETFDFDGPVRQVQALILNELIVAMQAAMQADET